MSVARIDSWRQPGCGDRCWPRAHSPEDHEAYGYWLGREAARPRIVQTGRLRIDRDTKSVDVGGAEIVLFSREWGILDYLAGHIGEPCRNADMMAEVWGGEYRPKRDNHLIRVTVSRLRARLGVAASLIETRPQFGYRLKRVPPIEVQS